MRNHWRHETEPLVPWSISKKKYINPEPQNDTWLLPIWQAIVFRKRENLESITMQLLDLDNESNCVLLANRMESPEAILTDYTTYRFSQTLLKVSENLKKFSAWRRVRKFTVVIHLRITNLVWHENCEEDARSNVSISVKIGTFVKPTAPAGPPYSFRPSPTLHLDWN